MPDTAYHEATAADIRLLKEGWERSKRNVGASPPGRKRDFQGSLFMVGRIKKKSPRLIRCLSFLSKGPHGSKRVGRVVSW